LGVDFLGKSLVYLDTLCGLKPNRCTGSVGNRAATDFFAGVVGSWGFNVDVADFPCFDYEVGEVSLTCQGEGFG